MINFRHTSYFFFALILLNSCAFNNSFLSPTVVDREAREQTLYIQEDTVLVQYHGEQYQPLFIRNGQDTVTFNHTIESVLFPSESGNELNGWLIIPNDIEIKGTILFFHGNAGDITGRHWNMNLLMQYGFQVFAVDYSGYGLSTGKAKRKFIIQDGISALEYIKQRKEVEGTKFIIYGQSLGGNLAASIAGRKGELIDGLVVEGAFSSHKDIGRRFAGFLSDWFVKEMYSAKESVQHYHKPILVIHSVMDFVVPLEHGKTIYDNANEPKEFYIINDCHTCGSRIYHKEIGEKLLEMIGE